MGLFVVFFFLVQACWGYYPYAVMLVSCSLFALLSLCQTVDRRPGEIKRVEKGLYGVNRWILLFFILSNGFFLEYLDLETESLEVVG